MLLSVHLLLKANVVRLLYGSDKEQFCEVKLWYSCIILTYIIQVCVWKPAVLTSVDSSKCLIYGSLLSYFLLLCYPLAVFILIYAISLKYFHDCYPSIISRSITNSKELIQRKEGPKILFLWFLNTDKYFQN